MDFSDARKINRDFPIPVGLETERRKYEEGANLMVIQFSPVPEC
jgi:hypothetical protein